MEPGLTCVRRAPRPGHAFLTLLLATLALLPTGCAREHRKSALTARDGALSAAASARTQPLIEPDLEPQGRVVSVNTRLRFVVLEFPPDALPALQERLGVYRDGQRQAELRVSGPQQGTTIVADILEGTPEAGDRVRH
jgi:hypothetical protein